MVNPSNGTRAGQRLLAICLLVQGSLAKAPRDTGTLRGFSYGACEISLISAGRDITNSLFGS